MLSGLRSRGSDSGGRGPAAIGAGSGSGAVIGVTVGVSLVLGLAVGVVCGWGSESTGALNAGGRHAEGSRTTLTLGDRTVTAAGRAACGHGGGWQFTVHCHSDRGGQCRAEQRSVSAVQLSPVRTSRCGSGANDAAHSLAATPRAEGRSAAERTAT